MKDEFKIGDRVQDKCDGCIGRIIAIAEYECYVSWHVDYASWVPTSLLEKVED